MLADLRDGARAAAFALASLRALVRGRARGAAASASLRLLVLAGRVLLLARHHFAFPFAACFRAAMLSRRLTPPAGLAPRLFFDARTRRPDVLTVSTRPCSSSRRYALRTMLRLTPSRSA